MPAGYEPYCPLCGIYYGIDPHTGQYNHHLCLGKIEHYPSQEIRDAVTEPFPGEGTEIAVSDKRRPQRRPEWDEIWMGFAHTLAKRSTCRRAAVGCVIVSFDNSIVMSLGYNGGAKGLNNDCLSDEPGKCGHLHAEINALIKLNYRDAAPKRVYTTTSPCYGCSVALVNAGVKEVVFDTLYRDSTGLGLLVQAGIAIRQFPEKGLPERYLQEQQDGQP